jgi:hypothetical protein
VSSSIQKTLFALDCGATNWRLYRVEYRVVGQSVEVMGEPQPASLTSFVDRKLPAVICLNSEGTALESYGDVAQQQQEDERCRERVREYFKPCIGAYLESDPLPHQKRYTHAQALLYTKMLLESVVKQIRQEKWRGQPFDERVSFTFAYPIHWYYGHEGKIYEDFRKMVQECIGSSFNQIRFVPEPEGAILCLQRGGLLSKEDGKISLIIDVGGSTTDIVAGRIEPNTGNLDYIGRHGEPFGGGLYDFEIAKCIADDLNIPASALADDPSSLVTLQVYGKRLKESLSRQLLHTEQLSQSPQRMITLVMHDGSIYRRMVALDEAKFRNLTRHLDRSFEALIDTALKTMSIQEGGIGQVVLVGGGAQLFTILEHLRKRFGDQNVVLADNAEEIVVRGVGLEYGASSGRLKSPVNFLGKSPSLQEKETSSVPLSSSDWKLTREDGTLIAIPTGVTKIGRGEGNQVRIDDLKASRFHAELHVKDNNIEVIDLGSTNGTFVNGSRLIPNQPQLLNDNDVISIGMIKFVCRK